MEFKEGLLYEIYFDDNDSTDDFDVGFFVAKDEGYVVFQCVGRDGFVGGLLLAKIENIWNLQSDTIYCQSLNKLIKYHGTKFEKISFKAKNLKKEFLALAQETRAITGIELRDSGSTDLFGFVENVSDDFVITLEVSNDGYADGNGQCRFNDITKIHMNATRHRKYKILFDINSK